MSDGSDAVGAACAEEVGPKFGTCYHLESQFDRVPRALVEDTVPNSRGEEARAALQLRTYFTCRLVRLNARRFAAAAALIRQEILRVSRIRSAGAASERAVAELVNSYN